MFASQQGYASQYTQGPPPQQYNQYGGPPQQQHQQYQPQQQYQQRPPAQIQQIDPQVRSWFQSVDRDGPGFVTAIELHQSLMNGDWTPFVRLTFHSEGPH